MRLERGCSQGFCGKLRHVFGLAMGGLHDAGANPQGGVMVVVIECKYEVLMEGCYL